MNPQSDTTHAMRQMQAAHIVGNSQIVSYVRVRMQIISIVFIGIFIAAIIATAQTSDLSGKIVVTNNSRCYVVDQNMCDQIVAYCKAGPTIPYDIYCAADSFGEIKTTIKIIPIIVMIVTLIMMIWTLVYCMCCDCCRRCVAIPTDRQASVDF